MSCFDRVRIIALAEIPTTKGSGGSFDRTFGDLLGHLVLEVHPEHQPRLSLKCRQDAEQQANRRVEAELQVGPDLMQETPLAGHRRIDLALDEDQSRDVKKRDVDQDEGV